MKYFYSNYIGKSAKYGEKYGLKVNPEQAGVNDEIDAFRHCFSQALLTLKFSEGFAKSFGTNYERLDDIANQQPPEERNMDQWNNAIGRDVAQEVQKEISGKKLKPQQIEDIVAEKVVKHIKNGDLITNPKTDKRKYNEKTFKDRIFDIKNRIFHKNEVSMKDLDDPILRDAFLDQALEYEPMPTKEALDKRVQTGELVYVSEYTRGDGTKVSGYYRSYPNNQTARKSISQMTDREVDELLDELI